VVVDSRAARVLPEGRRDMIDQGEWTWISDHARGEYDHLVIASTLPVFMIKGVHHLEAWSEAVCGGAWGPPGRRVGEWARRLLDLDHWPAFQRSFAGMVGLLDELALAEGHPASITLIGGDVHTAYIAEVGIGDGRGSRVHQVVCSPFRNPLDPHQRRLVKATTTRGAELVTRGLARAAGVGPPPAGWRFRDGPTFDNSVAVLELDERTSRVTISRSGPEDEDGPVLTHLHRRTLASA